MSKKKETYSRVLSMYDSFYITILIKQYIYKASSPSLKRWLDYPEITLRRYVSKKHIKIEFENIMEKYANMKLMHII